MFIINFLSKTSINILKLILFKLLNQIKTNPLRVSPEKFNYDTKFLHKNKIIKKNNATIKIQSAWEILKMKKSLGENVRDLECKFGFCVLKNAITFLGRKGFMGNSDQRVIITIISQ